MCQDLKLENSDITFLTTVNVRSLVSQFTKARNTFLNSFFIMEISSILSDLSPSVFNVTFVI